MFRDKKSKTPILTNNFGAGSIVDGYTTSWLLVTTDSNNKRIALVNLTTFEIDNSLLVDDPNHLAEDELRKLLTFSPDAFSDHAFRAAGIKADFRGYGLQKKNK